MPPKNFPYNNIELKFLTTQNLMFKNNDKTQTKCYNAFIMERCPRCGSIHFVKNGKRKTEQKLLQSYLCKNCKVQFTENSKQKNSLKHIKIAIALYKKGLSLRLIAKIFRLKSASTIYYWNKKYGELPLSITNAEIKNFIIKSNIVMQTTNKQFDYLMKFLYKLKD